MEEVTVIYAEAKYIICPYCNEYQYGWVSDPRRSEKEVCDNCGKEYKVSKHADIELY